MNTTQSNIDQWLVAIDQEEVINEQDVWDPGFDVDRQIVISKIGPYKKIYLRPEKFNKRFYHTVYPLSIEEWQSIEQIKLYDGFCTMTLELDVRFQATFHYALRNIEILTELNEHIKNAYHGLTLDIVNRELLNLSDGGWVHAGLEPVEKKISAQICEMLILQNIQSQVVCQLTPEFEEFPDVQFARESVYLSVLKKSFEFNEQQRAELFRQQQEEENQKIEHKRKLFKQINKSAELERERQALYAANNKRFLEEKEQFQLQQFEIKKKIHANKVKHNSDLKQMDLIAEFEERERYHNQLLEKEQQEKLDRLEQQTKLKEKALEAKITAFEKEKERWRKAKTKAHAEELELKHHQNQLEFDTEVGYKKRLEIQRLAMQEESYAARNKSDIYLKREIELLELEKERLALQLSIKEYKEKAKNLGKEQEA